MTRDATRAAMRDMTREQRAQARAAQREADARSDHRFGLWASAIGAVFTVAALALVYLAALVATVRSGDDPAEVALAVSSLASLWPVLLLFLGMCALCLGEQMRRGAFASNPKPPATALPSASVVSSFRLLPLRWHALWASAGLVVAATLLVPVMVAFFTGGWPLNLPAGRTVQLLWGMYGAVAFTCAFAVFSSLVKKRTTLHAHAAGRTPSPEHRKAWRFWLYRWRVDLWLSTVGSFIAAAAAVAFVGDLSAGGATALTGGIIAVAGAAMAICGIALGTQFWRSGESLGTGESFA